MKMKFVLAFTFLLLFPHNAFSAPKEWKVLSLPPIIEAMQEIKTIPAGWVVSQSADAIHLAGIIVYDGRPEDNASLVPDKVENRKI